jgi:hypothetical protein
MADEPANKYPQAEAQFKKAQRTTQGAKVMSDYKAEGETERAKTARLKELRLAKKAGEKTAKVNENEKPPKAPTGVA